MKKSVIITIAVTALLFIAGIAAYLLFFSGNNQPKPVTYQEYELGELYTNIADDKKILKFNVVVEYSDKEETTMQKLDENKTKITNNIYEIFRRKTYDQTQSPSFQERTREEIREMIIEVLGTDAESITNVYFLQFIIQG